MFKWRHKGNRNTKRTNSSSMKWIARILFFIVLAALISLAAKTSFGQTVSQEGQYKGIQRVIGGMKVDSFMWLPIHPLTSWQYAPTTQIPNIGGVLVNPTDTLPYYMKKPGTFSRFLLLQDTTLFPDAIDTTSLSNRINQKQNFTDTNTYDATKYWVRTQGYGTGSVTNVATSAGLIGGPITTTGTLQVDSSVIPKWTDTLAGNRWIVTPKYLSSFGYGTGSVTSVGTGYGVSGGTFTTSGTIVLDSGTAYPAVLNTLLAGYGLTKSSRTFLADTATMFTALAATFAAGYAMSKSGRTYTLDTSIVYAYARSVASGGTDPWSYYKVATNVTSTVTALVDITGLVTGTLDLNSTYEFEAKLMASCDNTNGNKYGVNITVAPTFVFANYQVSNGAAGQSVQSTQVANNTGTATVMNVSNGFNGLVTIWGEFTTAGTGSPVFSVRHQKVTSGTSTIYAGSLMRMRKVQ